MLSEIRLHLCNPETLSDAQVAQPFDGAKFNFCKALQKEVLFEFCGSGVETFEPAVAVRGSPNLVFINVSPIEYGHVLLVPRTLERLPQLVEPASLLLALHFAKAAKNAYFRIGFNSLGAYGTINHLHFQVRRRPSQRSTAFSRNQYHVFVVPAASAMHGTAEETLLESSLPMLCGPCAGVLPGGAVCHRARTDGGGAGPAAPGARRRAGGPAGAVPGAPPFLMAYNSITPQNQLKI